MRKGKRYRFKRKKHSKHELGLKYANMKSYTRNFIKVRGMANIRKKNNYIFIL